MNRKILDEWPLRSFEANYRHETMQIIRASKTCCCFLIKSSNHSCLRDSKVVLLVKKLKQLWFSRPSKSSSTSNIFVQKMWLCRDMFCVSRCDTLIVVYCHHECFMHRRAKWEKAAGAATFGHSRSTTGGGLLCNSTFTTDKQQGGPSIEHIEGLKNIGNLPKIAYYKAF